MWGHNLTYSWQTVILLNDLMEVACLEKGPFDPLVKEIHQVVIRRSSRKIASLNLLPNMTESVFL